ncbi:MAG: hypothetical protein LBG46_01220 [Elusimicrobiota bacterium]|jgi:hypothetical protein|nr:hypothetical protein [Elusimicrobiota bacterium]
MPKIDIYNKILLNILALDKGFEEFEFYHTFLGKKELSKQASLIPIENACSFLKETLKDINNLGIKDEFPYYRKTYIRDLLKCVIAQTDFFVFKKKIPFKTLEKDITAAPILEPFNIQKEFEQSSKKIKDLAGMTIKQMRLAKYEEVNCFKELKKYVSKIIEENIYLLNEYNVLFSQFDLAAITSKMKIKIVNEEANGSPCFFKYNGNYCATIGLAYSKNVSKKFLKGFVRHEGIPGHFLYYCIKQYLADGGKTDAASLIDTFYSPENCLNEGLAVCSDLIFTKLVLPHEQADVEAEKLLHKIFYNLWHSANIKDKSTSLEYKLLKEYFNLSGGPGRLIKYFTKDEKYYTPYYPYGIHYAQKYIPKIKKENLGFLYHQHSVNTLKKLTEEQL